MIADWVSSLQSELASWKEELSKLESRAVDKQAIFNSARNKANYLLRRAAESAELLPDMQENNEQSGRNVVATVNQNADGNPKRFYIVSRRNSIFAECDVYSENRIVVLAGSTATKRAMNPGREQLQKRKDQLIADGVLVDDGRLYKFASDQRFTSATAAQAIVLGRPENARRNLKDGNGIPFTEHYPK